MRHYVLTRSAFGRDVALAENRHRLELLRRVTVPSMRAQTNRDVLWVVLLADDDPLCAERRDAFLEADLPILFGSARGMIVRGQKDRPTGPWARYLRFDQVTLTMRMDDDDAIAPFVLEMVRGRAEATDPMRRVVWTLSDGWRIAGAWAERAHWPIPMFSTLQVPPRVRRTIFDTNHLGAARLAPLSPIESEPAWLWVRHASTRSSHLGPWTHAEWREHAVPINDAIRAGFPIDWPFIESQEADQWT
jgi:hypothetical protein